MKKILLITNTPTPYRIAFFNELHDRLKDSKINFKVVFAALSYASRSWDIDMSECRFDYVILNSSKINFLRLNREKVVFAYSGLGKVIRQENPDIVIVSSFSLATVYLWVSSWFSKVKYIIWSGAIKNRFEGLVRGILRRILVRRAAGFITYGREAKEYLVYLGAQKDKIFVAINTVDTRYYENEVKKIRAQLPGTDETKHLLSVSYLYHGKRIDSILEAAAELLKKRKDFVLHIVGSGPEMNNLVNMAQKLGLGDAVRFEGNKRKEDILKYLARADCFLFSSVYDIWGNVLIEAMASGLCCIASMRAGATRDLIKDGVNGFIMDFSKTGDVAAKIDWVLDNTKEAARIAENASNFIRENATLEKSGAEFIKAVMAVDTKAGSN